MKPLLLAIAVAMAPAAAEAATLNFQAIRTGWYSTEGPNPQRQPNYFTGNLGGTFRSFFAFDLRYLPYRIPAGHTITEATLLIHNPTSASPQGVEILGLFQVLTSIEQIDAGVDFAATYEDLGTGPSYGEVAILAGTGPPMLPITLTQAAVDDLRRRPPGALVIGGAIVSLSGIPALSATEAEFVFGDTGSIAPMLTLNTTPVPEPSSGLRTLAGAFAAGIWGPKLARWRR